tara:strand:+ start:50 stop:868 length:819 start_codon:yes stop_codon:yes gene_type:complete
MNTDISNTFLHHILSDRIHDLSDNPRGQFMGMLVNLLSNNDINSNLAMLPLANNFATSQINQNQSINRILNDSLLMRNTPYKKIISEKGVEDLKSIKYNKESCEQHSCCITFEDFEEGQDITQLPCKHIFDPQAINTWLKEESNKCPVCRFELDYIEVKDDEENEDEEENEEDEDEDNDEDNEEDNEEENSTTVDGYNQLFNTIGFINNPIENLYRPQRRNLINQRRFVNQVMNVENQFLENRIMQNAIMASIYDQNIEEGPFNDTILEEFD